EKAPDNYSAYAPDVPGCITTGKTVEETLRLMQEALAAHLQLTREEGYPLPEISANEAHFVLVDVPDNRPEASPTPPVPTAPTIRGNVAAGGRNQARRE